MTSPIKLNINKLLKGLRDKKQPLDFSFLEYLDKSTMETMFRCPLFHDENCPEEFFASNDHENLCVIFHHIWKNHSNDREAIKNNFNRWYITLKNTFSSSSSSSINDILTSHDVEELSKRKTTTAATRTTLYDKDQRKLIVVDYQQTFNQLIWDTHKEMDLFLDGNINEHQLKLHIKSLNNNYIKKIEKL